MENNQKKICTKCKIEKELSLFNNTKKTKDGLCCFCKSCISIYYVNYKEIKKEKRILSRDKNKEKIAKKTREYYDNNIDKIKEMSKKYYLKNKEKLKQQRKKRNQTEKGKAVIFNYTSKRRTIKKDGDVTTQEILKLKQNIKVCYWCNESLKNKKIHIDHYIPLSKGGKHTISNLVISCEKCNLSKHNKDPFKFANEIGKLL